MRNMRENDPDKPLNMREKYECVKAINKKYPDPDKPFNMTFEEFDTNYRRCKSEDREKGWAYFFKLPQQCQKDLLSLLECHVNDEEENVQKFVSQIQNIFEKHGISGDCCFFLVNESWEYHGSALPYARTRIEENDCQPP